MIIHLFSWYWWLTSSFFVSLFRNLTVLLIKESAFGSIGFLYFFLLLVEVIDFCFYFYYFFSSAGFGCILLFFNQFKVKAWIIDLRSFFSNISIFFLSFYFNLSTSLHLKWVSCREIQVSQSFQIHSDNLSLLIGIFWPFTLNIMTQPCFDLGLPFYYLFSVCSIFHFFLFPYFFCIIQTF